MNKALLDFSSLANLDKLQRYKARAVLYAFLSGIIIVAASFFMNGSLEKLVVPLWLLGGAAIFLTARVAIQKNDQKCNAAIAQFAIDNSFDFQEKNLAVSEVGTLFTYGDSRSERKVITGNMNGYPLKLSNYRYSTGSGKSRRTNEVRVLRLTLPRKLPHMVIDCLVEPGEHVNSVLPISFDRSQRIELEGDFPEYFALYAPDKYAISALSIIAPDAMDTLLRMHSLCDIEIIDNYIYFYWPDESMSREQYENIFATVSAIIDEIGKKLSKSNIFASESQAKVHSEPAKPGVRLKKNSGLLGAAIFFACIFYTFIVNFYEAKEKQNPNADSSPMIIFTALTWIFVLFVLVIFIHKNNRRARSLKKLRERYPIKTIKAQP